MIVIMLCAGKGSRLKSKTSNLPKCMVKVKKKTIIDWSDDFRKKFNKTIIVCGYKKEILINKFKNNQKIDFSINKIYYKTNMVHSLFSVNRSKIKNQDLVVCYSDIIFNPNIYKKFYKNNFTFLPVNINWFKIWKKRMPLEKIKDDAEDLKIKGKKIISIGGKIGKIMPKFQFMGLIKIMNKDFFKLKKFYKNLDKNIDFTSFLNQAIKKKIIDIRYIKSRTEWYEIDSLKDLKYTESVRFKW
tara:strand:- start:3650 stop:4378 length:729 start_codon:yes stop_codon:yes gene_type:complete